MASRRYRAGMPSSCHAMLCWPKQRTHTTQTPQTLTHVGQLVSAVDANCFKPPRYTHRAQSTHQEHAGCPQAVPEVETPIPPERAGGLERQGRPGDVHVAVAEERRVQELRARQGPGVRGGRVAWGWVSRREKK